jgi:hypothetical protein
MPADGEPQRVPNAVTDVYDRHDYEAEDRRIMTAVAHHVIGLVEAEQTSNVVVLR